MKQEQLTGLGLLVPPLQDLPPCPCPDSCFSDIPGGPLTVEPTDRNSISQGKYAISSETGGSLHLEPEGMKSEEEEHVLERAQQRPAREWACTPADLPAQESWQSTGCL